METGAGQPRILPRAARGDVFERCTDGSRFEIHKLERSQDGLLYQAYLTQLGIDLRPSKAEE